MNFQNRFLILIVLVILAIIFIFWAHSVKKTGIGKVLYWKPGSIKIPIDFWTFTHVFAYFVAGYMVPGYFPEFALMSTLWELFEDALAEYHRKNFMRCSSKDDNVICGMSVDGDYWYSEVGDIVSNMLGYLLGEKLHGIYPLES